MFLVLMLQLCLAKQQQFLKEPTDLTVTAGQQVELSCSVQYKEGLLQWTKDGFGLGVTRDLPGYPSYTMGGQDPVRDWTLMIHNVGLGDDGTYQCQVGSGDSSEPIRSRPAVVTVLVPPGQPRILQGKREEQEKWTQGDTELEIQGEEGDDLVITCISDGGRPAGELSWRDEAGHLVLTDTDTSTHKMGDKSWRTVSVIRLRLGWEDRDRQIYCHVTSFVSVKPLQAVVMVRVRFRPRVTLQTGGAVTEGGDLEATCSTEAHPPPSAFAWYLDGVLIIGAEEEHLILEELTRVNEGAKLECEATNLEGSGRDSTILHVTYGPEIKEAPKTVKAQIGQQASFHCKADGNPAPSYTWTRAGSNEPLGMSEILTLVATNHTEGQYLCHVSVEGFPPLSSTPASLLLVIKPSILSPEVQPGSVGSMVRLECRVATAGRKNLITWDRGGRQVSGQEPGITLTFTEEDTEQTSVLMIKNARREDFGSYGCKAANEVGVEYKLFNLKQEDFILGGNDIIYIILGFLALATLILLGALCMILYQKRKRSNLKYIHAAKQKQMERERKAEEYKRDEDTLEKEFDLQLASQPDLIQPLKRDLPPRPCYNENSEEDDPMVPMSGHTIVYSPQRKPFAIDRFLQSPSSPVYEPHTEVSKPLNGINSSKMACGDWQKERNQMEEEKDQFLTLLPSVDYRV